MHIEVPGLVVDRIDKDGEGCDFAARAAMEGVKEEETAPSLTMIAPIEPSGITMTKGVAR